MVNSKVLNAFSYSCRGILISVALVMLAGCRLLITVDETGIIISASETLDCTEGTCEIEVTDTLTETFTAIPSEGYRFVGWKGICRPYPSNTCHVKLSQLPEALEAFEGDMFLSAEFEPSTSMRPWYRDEDGDEYGSPLETVMAYERPDGFALNDRDCADDNGDVFPRAKEVADGRDNNCNGKVDEGFVERSFFYDGDRDGFGNPQVSQQQTFAPEGYVDNGMDCDDESATDHPEATEIADGRDNNCDGLVDEGGEEYFRDVDGDGFGTALDTTMALEPVEGYVSEDGDCDDNNDAIFPGAEEQFDGIDNDCDGETDEGLVTQTYYLDVDRDGYGVESETRTDTDRPSGYSTRAGDNCPEVYNPIQADIDNDGIGNACDTFTDSDEDEVQDSVDNCPSIHNPLQQDSDEDGLGDACDETDSSNDRDDDRIADNEDNCPDTYNPTQSDSDEDGLGNACDDENGLDIDEDGWPNEEDNCPEVFNPSQADTDEDGIGDTCDTVNNNPGNGGGNGGGNGNGNGGSTACSLSSEEQSMLNAVNSFRSQPQDCGSNGSFPAAGALTWSCPMADAALTHSMDMANNNFFSHTGSDGSSAGTRMTNAGYSWSRWGENIAAGQTSVSSVMNAWINSDGHCANLMNSSFTNFGSGKFTNTNSQYRVYWTQKFGRPR